MDVHTCDTIREALHFIPAHDRDLWLRIGMAIKSELSDGGFDLWDEWSRTADNYDPKAALTTWSSITPDGGLTIGTLYHEAQQNGFRFNGETRSQPPTAEEIEKREAFQRMVEGSKRQAELEERKRHEAAALKAAAILEAAPGDPETHPYAVKRRVPLGSLVKRGPWPQRGWDDALLVPIYGADGRLWSIEAINADGDKDSLKHGKKRGGFHPFGKIRGASRVFIAEGVANAAVGAELDKSPAVAAMGKSNLLHAALAVRGLAPDAELIILADNDLKLPKEANEAAVAVDGRVAVPELDGRKCDLWDLWNERGIEAVKATIVSAEDLPAANGASRVILVRGDDLHVEPIRWLWDGWLARGKLHMLAGAPGTGKSTIALTLAAVVTTGGRWPDGTTCIPGHVLVWSGEDDAADTLLPRLLAAGGDPRRFHIVSGTVDRDGARPFDPAMDIPPLLTAARGIPDCMLVLADPVVAAVLGDSHKNTEVRRALQPLVSFAAELDVAVLGVSHFSKGTAGRDPVERVTGSVAFGALPRVVMATARVREADTERRIFCRAKSNIGPDTGGWDYRLDLTDVPGTPGVTAVRVRWGDALEGAARDLLAEAEVTSDPEERSALEDAKSFLRNLLADGPVSSKQIKADAEGAGYSWPTVKRAKKDLGIEAIKSGMKGQWEWKLSPKGIKSAEGDQTKSMSPFGRNDPLRPPSGADDDLAEGSL